MATATVVMASPHEIQGLASMVTTPPDYTAQLNQIVQALNHPTTPAWIIAALSAALGLISGIFAQLVLVRINDAYQRDRMRRVLYTDLGGYC